MNDREIGKNFIKARQEFRNNPYYINPNQRTDIKFVKRRMLKKRNNDTLKKKFLNCLISLSQNEKLLKKLDNGFNLILGASILAAVSFIKFNDIKSYGGGQGFEDTFSGRSTGKLSQRGRDFIINEEGMRLTSYKDSSGVWTIGIGHTGNVNGKPIGPNMTITKEKALELFDNDIQRFEDYVNKVVKVPVSQNMFDAMVSYSFNVGSLGPNFLTKINSKDYKGAMAELTTKNKELQARRKREQELFGKDITTQNTLYLPSNQVKVGSKIGGYKIGEDVKMSEPVKQVLEEAGGKGYISSVIRENAPHTQSSHWSGNKFDLGLGGLSIAKVIEEVVPIMSHPAVVQVGFECFGKNTTESNKITRSIEAKIKEQYPDIAKRIQTGSLRVEHWGWGSGGTGPHIDVLIDPNKLSNKTSNLNVTNKTDKLALNNINNTKPISEQIDEEELIPQEIIASSSFKTELPGSIVAPDLNYNKAYQKGWRNGYSALS